MQHSVLRDTLLPLLLGASSVWGASTGFATAGSLFQASVQVQTAAVVLVERTPMNFGTLLLASEPDPSGGVTAPQRTERVVLTPEGATLAIPATGEDPSHRVVRVVGKGSAGTYSVASAPTSLRLTVKGPQGPILPMAKKDFSRIECNYDTPAEAQADNRIVVVNSSAGGAFFCLDGFHGNFEGASRQHAGDDAAFRVGAVLATQTPRTPRTQVSYRDGTYSGKLELEIAY